MSKPQLAVFGTLLVGVAMQIAGLPNWHAALTPSFVSGLVLTVGAVIGGVYTPIPAPKAPEPPVSGPKIP